MKDLSLVDPEIASAIAEENAQQARELMEQKIREDLEINNSPEELENKCPACGADLSADHTECPDCGLNFG